MINNNTTTYDNIVILNSKKDDSLTITDRKDIEVKVSKELYVYDNFRFDLQQFCKKEDSEKEKFELWIVNLEELAKKAMHDRKIKSNIAIVISVIDDLRMANKSIIDSLFSNDACSVSDYENINLSSFFHAIRFIREIPLFYINNGVLSIDKDSFYVNMSFVNKYNRLDITFIENGEINYRFTDHGGGRVRISGSSFFGTGRNQSETKKISKLLSLIRD
ncbi:hypothetical protein [Providencia hangzhouensis]|uniref:hypothetical protein n=1 Tax=Providencia hangzhouensis TaxID=3031799 RepID=UPI0034DD51FC